MMEILRPLKAIRRHCLDCMCGQSREVALCPSQDNCPLWPYRFGRRPKTIGIVTDFEDKSEDDTEYHDDE